MEPLNYLCCRCGVVFSAEGELPEVHEGCVHPKLPSMIAILPQTEKCLDEPDEPRAS